VESLAKAADFRLPWVTKAACKPLDTVDFMRGRISCVHIRGNCAGDGGISDQSTTSGSAGVGETGFRKEKPSDFGVIIVSSGYPVQLVSGVGRPKISASLRALRPKEHSSSVSPTRAETPKQRRS
jgi:hypothetical protein